MFEYNSKRIAKKQQQAQNKLHQQQHNTTHPRLPPGQKLVSQWPILDLGIVPDITKQQWQLTINGHVKNPQILSWNDFSTLPQITLTTDIHCVTTWSRYDNTWQGISAKTLLNLVQPYTNALYILFSSYDGYTTNLQRNVFDDDDVCLAHSWNHQPLTPEHGGPVRVVVPKMYFWKSAKWIQHITFQTTDTPGFWEVRGYHNEGDPWKQQRYSL